MRQLLAALLLYLLFLAQAALSPFSPDLLLLALFIFALHENKLAVTMLGLLCGLCLDLTAPSTAGVNILVYAGLAYGVASLHTLLYRPRWNLAILTAVGLIIKYSLHAVAGAGLPGLLPIAVSAAITIALVVPVDLLLSQLFYRRWQTS